MMFTFTVKMKNYFFLAIIPEFDKVSAFLQKELLKLITSLLYT